jgi:hypothetical protein
MSSSLNACYYARGLTAHQQRPSALEQLLLLLGLGQLHGGHGRQSLEHWYT